MQAPTTPSKKAPFIIGSLILVLLVAGGVFGVFYYLHKTEPKPVVYDKADPVARQQVEGREEVPVAPDALAGYDVAPDEPRILTIDSIDVRARILPMGVNPDNSMQAPVNIYDSGWYNRSAKPGQAGASVIDAHASGPTRQGLFAYLDTLKQGDRVSVERGDGETLNYEVMMVETVSLSAIDMEKVLRPYGDATEALNLITCAGQWLQDQRTYDQRAIVYTKRI